MRVPLKAIRDVDFPERERGYLDIEKLAPLLPDAATVWISDFVADLRRRHPPAEAARCRDAGVARVRPVVRVVRRGARRTSPGRSSRTSANVFWNQVLFDVLFEYPIHSDRSAFSIRPGLERLAARVVTVLRFLPPGGAVRAYEFPGDPGLVPLDPRWHQAARRFVELGFFHILDGTDHLLFLLCLVIPFRRFRAADPGGDRVHRGALDYADRVRLQSRRRTRCGFRR